MQQKTGKKCFWPVSATRARGIVAGRAKRLQAPRSGSGRPAVARELDAAQRRPVDRPFARRINASRPPHLGGD